MTKKRDIIEEIPQKRIRSDYSSRLNYYFRFDRIQKVLDEINIKETTITVETMRYIPLAAIAATEAFFRFAYKDLIDQENDYLINSIKYLKETNAKFDLDLLGALTKKQVSVGEIISHQLQLNNLNDITFTLTKILNLDFLDEIKKMKFPRTSYKHENNSHFRKNFGACLTSVNRMFEYRHIFAHEFAINVKTDLTQLVDDFQKIVYFITCCDEFFGRLLNENRASSQVVLNHQAHRKFKEKELELNKLIKLIKTKDKESD